VNSAREVRDEPRAAPPLKPCSRACAGAVRAHPVTVTNVPSHAVVRRDRPRPARTWSTSSRQGAGRRHARHALR
jgi:hypothetical protein